MVGLVFNLWIDLFVDVDVSSVMTAKGEGVGEKINAIFGSNKMAKKKTATATLMATTGMEIATELGFDAESDGEIDSEAAVFQ
jgi:hypothetical protein